METNIKKEKVLILYNCLFHYRIPIFNLLSEKCDLTVSFSHGPDSKEKVNFKILKLPVHQYKRFVIHKENIFKLCQNFDVVIAYGDIAWLNFSTLTFHKHRVFKIIFWSIGVSASYNKKYDAISKWDSVRDFFYRRADALLFYSDYPKQKYRNRGFNSEKLFVAPNTVEVYNDNGAAEKKSILFIGTLYMEKGILTLLENYKIAYTSNADIFPLNIVGGGKEFEKVKDWIEKNALSHKILLRGPIYDIKTKSSYFKSAFACISPVQAGLSVLESMGYGVPFITMHDAITGGERLNIKNGINGILMEEINQLKDIILDISKNQAKYLQMGKNALAYYRNSHKPEDMANGIYESIEFVLK